MYSYVSPEQRIAENHPLRSIRRMCDEALGQLSGRFGRLYSKLGRRSVPPEQLLRTLLLQVLYSVRSERQLMEQLEYNLLFRWFVGLSVDEKVWDATVFSKNRQRLLQGDIAQAFFERILEQARQQSLLSEEHFTVDGTLLEAWASQKSFQKKKEPPQKGSGARGKILLRDTHECKTDPDAKMYQNKAGGTSGLCHMGHVLMENRHYLPVAARVTEASTGAEWEAGLDMLRQAAAQGGTVGGDAGYDYERFVTEARKMGVTAHVVQHRNRSSSIDARTTRHPGYCISVHKRRAIEHIFGWLKNTGRLRKLRHRGRALVQWNLTFALAAFTLVRMRTLTVPPVGT
jgi:transposase